MSKTRIISTLHSNVKAKVPYYKVTIELMVHHDKACDQTTFKSWIVEGLSKLDLTQAVDTGNDPTTDIAQDLNGQTIEITVI